MRLDKTIGAMLELSERAVFEAGPDFRLPAAVETFNGCLKARFARWGKDGRDVETQTKAHDPADDITMLMRTLEESVIIELCVVGQSERTPTLHKQIADHARVEQFAWPSANQAAMEGDPVENDDLRSPTNDQARNRIEAVELVAAGGHIGQVPSSRRWSSADAPVSIERAAATEDAANGSGCRRLQFPAKDLLANRDSAILTEIAAFLHLSSDGQDQIFARAIGAIVHAARTCRPIPPVHSVQTLVACPTDPPLHRVKTDPK